MLGQEPYAVAKLSGAGDEACSRYRVARPVADATPEPPVRAGPGTEPVVTVVANRAGTTPLRSTAGSAGTPQRHAGKGQDVRNLAALADLPG